MIPIIAITGGDPCGIGPEVILKVLSTLAWRGARLIVIGDLRVLSRTAARLRIPVRSWEVVRPEGVQRWRDRRSSRIAYMDHREPGKMVLGRPSKASGRAALAYLDCAVRLWRSGHIQGLVTAPVTKWAITRSLPAFVGQTEHLAAAMRAKRVVMMFISRHLRVALLTRHVPIRDVGRIVDQRLVRQTIEVAVELLRRRFQIRNPRLAVCGLNPHAGEQGLFGLEERRVLLPALGRLRRRGMRLEGPLAPDGLFPLAHRYDAVVCWYHDQALIPFKLMARDAGCQISAGLPIVRTSPDHGSALDIAGKGIAHPGSMRYALQLAIKLASTASPA